MRAVSALTIAGCLASGNLSAQTPGTQDPSFKSDVIGSTIYAISTGSFYGEQRSYVGGDFAAFDRVYPNGVVDIAYNLPVFGNLSYRIVYTIAQQVLPAGAADPERTLVGGFFGETATDSGNALAGLTQNIARLHIDGTLDTSFNPGYGANAYVTAIVPEPNGSMYVGGLFDHFNHIEHHHVVRLNVDGSLDNTFSSGLNIDDAVLNVADQINPATGAANGQILVVGTFHEVDKTPTAKIARLNNDGSLDTTFRPVINTRVLSVFCQADGKIVIGGSFTSVNGAPVQNIARLNMDGSLDTTFVGSVTMKPPLSPDPLAVYVLKPLSDNRFYVGGNFYSVNGVQHQYLARLLRNGELDTEFDSGTAVINSVQAIAIQPNNNRVLVGETVSRKVNNIFPASIIRLFSNNPP